MSRLDVDPDIAELAIGHKRTGLDWLYNFNQSGVATPLRAFVKFFAQVAQLLSLAAEEGKNGRHPNADLLANHPPLTAPVSTTAPAGCAPEAHSRPRSTRVWGFQQLRRRLRSGPMASGSLRVSHAMTSTPAPLLRPRAWELPAEGRCWA